MTDIHTAAEVSCELCERDCPACGWPIEPGWKHETTRSATHVVCRLARVQPQPLADALVALIEHAEHTTIGNRCGAT